MKDDEIREFLMGWLLEFGTGVVGHERHKNKWYVDQNIITHHTVITPPITDYFNGCLDSFQLSQAGLDFIKGEDS